MMIMMMMYIFLVSFPSVSSSSWFELACVSVLLGRWFFFSPKVDFVAIAPFFINLAVDSGGGGLAVLRVLRLARVFRVFRVGAINEGDSNKNDKEGKRKREGELIEIERVIRMKNCRWLVTFSEQPSIRRTHQFQLVFVHT
jgi:hypothetical protein